MSLESIIATVIGITSLLVAVAGASIKYGHRIGSWCVAIVEKISRSKKEHFESAIVAHVDRHAEDFAFSTWLRDLEWQHIDINPFEAGHAERAAWETELEDMSGDSLD